MAEELTPKVTILIPTLIPIHILIRPIFFADIVKKGPNIAPEAIPNNTGISLKPVPQKAKPTNYKDRRLILNEATEKDEKIDSLKLRNQINKGFQEKEKIATPVIVMVTKSFLEKNIILIIIKQYSAEFLTQNKVIWEPYFKFRNATKDFIWYKVIIHRILTEIFGQEKGLDFLAEEIKIFNRINFIVRPN
jgi:hypothetical protein